MTNLSHRLRPWLHLLALAAASTCATAQTCPNQVGFAFTVSTNVSPYHMVLMGERYQGTGQYAAQLVLNPEIMAHLATSLAAGCTQRVNYAGAGMGSWTWNLGRTSLSSITRLQATSLALARTWKLGEWGARHVVLQGVQDQYLSNSFQYPFDQELPLRVVRTLQEGDQLDVLGEARVRAISVGGGIYDQANVNAYWPASYFPFLMIGLP
ncbi:hypothetical protein [Ideonella alba]|uniref:Uncharacterized protein n=1 Tax=Ideonella alba TaxID=2824118 RepID=A0A940Y689_9BURK|nr:hypothetical protein [Ideonella alba]MBQ0929050.1 hypothetical protein [Ideonella alba]